jgi:hypothetical protein
MKTALRLDQSVSRVSKATQEEKIVEIEPRKEFELEDILEDDNSVSPYAMLGLLQQMFKLVCSIHMLGTAQGVRKHSMEHLHTLIKL